MMGFGFLSCGGLAGGYPSRSTPGAFPAWRVGQAVGEVRAISGTAFTLVDADAINAWGSLPFVPPATLVSPANGGHNDSSDNSVNSIDLMANAPSWVTRIAASTAGFVDNANYYNDGPSGTPGKPNSRHGYHSAHYISQRSRVMLFTPRGLASSGGDGASVDGHTVSGTWTWDAPGTYPSCPNSVRSSSAHDPTTGNVWANGGELWNQASNTWSQPGTLTGGWRYPVAYDSTRAQFFAMQIGDGGPDSPSRGLFAQKFSVSNGAGTSITFNASAAYAQFTTDAGTSNAGGGSLLHYAGMDYDAPNDRFLFYSGVEGSAGRIYAVIPNSGSVWDMQLLTTTGATLPATVGAGMNGRFRYVAELGGFFIMPSAASGIYFLRTV